MGRNLEQYQEPGVGQDERKRGEERGKGSKRRRKKGRKGWTWSVEGEREGLEWDGRRKGRKEKRYREVFPPLIWVRKKYQEVMEVCVGGRE